MPVLRPDTTTRAATGGRASCSRCRRPPVACVCEAIPRVRNETAVVVVQHPREWRHPWGTVRLAALGLKRLQVAIARPHEGRLRCFTPLPPDALLLYPTDDAPPLVRDDVARVETLVVLDGTWPQSRRLWHDNPELHRLRRARLVPSRPGRYRIRRARRPEQLSTLEAIVAALQVLEPATAGLDSLLAAFEAMIDRQIALEQLHRRMRGASTSSSTRGSTNVSMETLGSASFAANADGSSGAGA